MRTKLWYLSALFALLAGAALPAAAGAGDQPISETATVGPYQVTLKVLPAEAFTGPDAEMVRDGGAEPVHLGGPEQPNHHLVAFVRKDGTPVEDATVEIRYRPMEGAEAGWTNLPVVRMHVAGKGLATTHYGNNVHLAPGRYEAAVTVDMSGPSVFRFSLPAGRHEK